MSALDRHLPKLLVWLTACADRGQVCPRATVIADRYGLSKNGGDRLLDRLVASGAITTERVGIGRVVTIVATGRSTARPFHLTPPGQRGDISIGAPA